MNYPKCEIYNDSFQNYKKYNIPKAQLVIADIPYNLGENAYASSPSWYNDGDNSNGESDKAKKAFFYSDYNFNLVEFWHFCNHLIIKEPKEPGKAGCMIIFCAFQQAMKLIETGKRYGFNHGFPIFFFKNYSAQVLKSNMKIVGATECAVVMYREKLPKFNNCGQMIFDYFPWIRDGKNVPKIHPTQKPISVLKRLIEIFTDPGDTVIDPVAGSGSTLAAAASCWRNAYGLEIDKNFCKLAREKMFPAIQYDFKDSALIEKEKKRQMFLEIK